MSRLFLGIAKKTSFIIYIFCVFNAAVDANAEQLSNSEISNKLTNSIKMAQKYEEDLPKGILLESINLLSEIQSMLTNENNGDEMLITKVKIQSDLLDAYILVLEKNKELTVLKDQITTESLKYDELNDLNSQIQNEIDSFKDEGDI